MRKATATTACALAALMLASLSPAHAEGGHIDNTAPALSADVFGSTETSSTADDTWVTMWVRDVALRGAGTNDERRQDLCAGAAKATTGSASLSGGPDCGASATSGLRNLLYLIVVGLIDGPARDALLAGLSS